jgi:hypothetical protein
MWQWLRDLLSKLTPGPLPAAERDTAGPPDDEHPIPDATVVHAVNQSPAFVDGWWTRGGCQRTPANLGRIGPVIVPQRVVLHTTDMLGRARAIVDVWGRTRGAGNAATFLIGRDAADGVYQLAPITRNTNHAGGKKHGWFKTPTGHLVHPNTVTIGIEVHNGGALELRGMSWVHPDTGTVIPRDQVYIDVRGRGWHKPTDWQLGVLNALLADLRDALLPAAKDHPLTYVPDGDHSENGVPWAGAIPPGSWLVGHATLDPVNKTDPGPLLLQYARSYELPPANMAA